MAWPRSSPRSPRFLGRAVALEGRRGDALAVHAPAGAPDAGAAVARYHARPRQAVALRVPLPAAGDVGGGAAGRSAGSVALLGERPVGELERVSLARIAGLLALELARDEAVRRARDQARRAEALPAAGPPWVVLLARQRTPGADDDRPADRERRDAVRRELRLLAPARRLALRGDADSLEIRAVAGRRSGRRADPEGLAIAEPAGRLPRPDGGRLAPVRDGRRPAGGRGRGAGDPRERRAASRRRRRSPGPTRLPVYRLLGALHNLPDGERLARALLEPLLDGPGRHPARSAWRRCGRSSTTVA